MVCLRQYPSTEDPEPLLIMRSAFARGEEGGYNMTSDSRRYPVGNEYKKTTSPISFFDLSSQSKYLPSP